MSIAQAIRNARTFKRAQCDYDNLADPWVDADDADECTSLQPLGNAEVLVCFTWSAGEPVIEGAYVNADIVDVNCFAERVVQQWTAAIAKEWERDLS